jgi:hypothetical protein
MVYSVNCKDWEQAYVRETQRDKQYNAPRNMKYHQLLHMNNKLQSKVNLEGHLKFVTKEPDFSISSNTDGHIDNKKVVLLAFSKQENDTGYRIIWKDFRVVWRDENPSVQTKYTNQRIIVYPNQDTWTKSNNTLCTFDCVFWWLNSWRATAHQWLNQ